MRGHTEVLAQGAVGRVEAGGHGDVTLTVGYVTLQLGDEGLRALAQTLTAAVAARQRRRRRERGDLRLLLGELPG